MGLCTYFHMETVQDVKYISPRIAKIGLKKNRWGGLACPEIRTCRGAVDNVALGERQTK